MATGECLVCASPNRTFLHSVYHLGEIIPLCTSCVLRYKADAYCPVCFDLFDDDVDTHLLGNSRTMCLRCPAYAHNTCLPAFPPPPAFRIYICPKCLDPSFSFESFQPCASITRDGGKQLLCAAKISAASMQRAEAVAKEDAYQKSLVAHRLREDALIAADLVEFLNLRFFQQNQDDTDVDNTGVNMQNHPQEEIDVDETAFDEDDENDVGEGNSKEAIDRAILISIQQNQNENNLDDDETAVDDGNAKESSDEAFLTTNQQNQDKTHVDDDDDLS